MVQSSVTDNNSSCFRSGIASDIEVGLYLQPCPGRQAIENYISDKYFQTHHAFLNEYLPILVGFHGMDGFLGAYGLRPGQYRPMFLEQYLDSPVEQQVSSFSKKPVDRCALIEIGNLAITRRGYGSFVMVVMAMAIAEAGYEWMVFTVTEQVERLMNRLGFEPHYLVNADPDCLDGNKSCWGSYYENRPRVMVGSLKVARQVITDNERLYEIANQQSTKIAYIASFLLDYRRLRRSD